VEVANMAQRLAHRELRNRSAEILRDVAAGATYEVTNHGEVVAVLSPPATAGHLRVKRATVRGGFGEIARVRRHEATADALDDLRGDE
jgi:prevent-host-death family protein